MHPAYRNKLDQHVRELVGEPTNINKLPDYSFDGLPSDNVNDNGAWRFGPAPRQQQQRESFGVDSLGLGTSSHVSSHAFAPPGHQQPQREAFNFDNSRHGATSCVSPHAFGPSALTLPARLSFAPRSNQTQLEPRTMNMAENLFKYTQNLRDGVPISRQTSIYQAQGDQSPITQLANTMMLQRQMPLQRPGPEPFDQFQSFHQQRIQQLQPQKQQMTPPFNLNGFVHSPKATNSSSPPDASSPTTRISIRRSNNTFQSSNASTHRGFEERYDVPRTPHRQVAATPRSIKRTPQMLSLGHAPPMAHGIQLVSPHELPDRLRPIFPYELFNAAQSKCFTPIYRSDDNVVVSAPTGSGKTALLELAICRLVEGYPSGQFKIVYQAPTKSLCSERMRDWQKKFSHLNLPVAELTGDTSSAEMSKVGRASIIVTTPEKWDSITRKWKDYVRLLQLVKLFLIDEVHILKDIRGATLEAVVSRMKSIGASVRFVALSATVPNSHDIAVWLGKDPTNKHLPAHREIFGEDFRPVKLQKHVYGFEGHMNDFVFEKILNGKLLGLIQKHTHKKPIMVFCFTRKSCESTAVVLAEWWTRSRENDRAWPAPKQRTVVGHKELQELLNCGVAYHHAGLEVQDRNAIETAFLKGDISVICSTSTLAVGVNLPCHLVVLKGTVCFQNSGLCEYSDLEVMQMLGRAGRPQFDDSAVAIIMTRLDKADRYRKMIAGQDILESTLHLNLIEHLNSEIGLGTIHDVHSAKIWLAGTFLSVRMRLNPNYYKLDGVLPSRDADERLELVAERDIKLLQSHELITAEGRFKCTEYGEAMSRYMVQFETMKLLLSIPEHAKTEEILHILCQAAEFKDLRMKPNERPALREFNKSPFMKFPIKDNISTTSQKIYLMIQVQLGGIELPNTKDFPRRQFMAERIIIFDRVQRLVRCIVDCKSVDGDAIATRHALDLARSLTAEFWEYSSLQLRQLPQIGPAAVRKLAGNNVNSVDKLASLDTAGIERVVGKNPPFGRKMQEILLAFPSLLLDAATVGGHIVKAGKLPKVNVKCRIAYANAKVPFWNGRPPHVTFMAETTDGTLVHFWRGSIKQLSKGYEIKFVAEISGPDQDIRCCVASEEVVGTVRVQTIKVVIPASDFPPRTKTPEPKKQSKPILKDEDFEDEFGGNDFDDREFLAAVGHAEQAKHEYDSDQFLDIEDLDVNPTKDKAEKVPESYQMENGKWTCNHHCRGGTLKTGQPCKHRCCHEGLDKPRKLGTRKRKTSNSTADQPDRTAKKKLKTVDGRAIKKEPGADRSGMKSKVSAKRLNRHSSSERTEIFDLAKELPQSSYADIASHDYRKLHALHTSVQQDKSMSLPKAKPRFSYASGKTPDLPMFQANEDDDIDAIGSSDDDLISLPGLMRRTYHTGGATTYHTTPTDAATSIIEKSDYGLGTDHDFSPDDFNLPVQDEVELPPPKVDHSFENKFFDFDGFGVSAPEYQFTSPLMERTVKMPQMIATSPSPLLGKEYMQDDVVAKRLPKPSANQQTSEKEHHSEPLAGALADTQFPAWLDTIDSDLVDSLKGIVDFVE